MPNVPLPPALKRARARGSVEPPSVPVVLRTRRRIELDGLVQGVGFRAFVYRLAVAHGLTGFVRHRGSATEIQIQGPVESAERFAAALAASAPPGARVDAVRSTIRPPGLEREFRIAESALGDRVRELPSDRPICAACTREILDSHDRRHRYPFTHCARCGPRASILVDLPFDRCRTTMDRYEPCARCRAESADPANRRFHAQNLACPDCGPGLRLVLGGSPRRGPAGRVRRRDDPLHAVAGLLRRGAIVGVESDGVLRWMADANRAEVVAELRRRTGRASAPLVVLVPDRQRAAELVHLDEHAEALESDARPELWLPRQERSDVATSLSAGLDSVGVRLPFSALDVLLLAESRLPALVATVAHGEQAGLTHAWDEHTALAASVADAYLLQDRPIARRHPASVLAPLAGRLRPLRLGRGAAPSSFSVPIGAVNVLAVGGDQHNAPALAGGGRAVLLPHVGDLRDPEMAGELIASVAHHARILEVWPDVVVHDLEPDCVSTRLALTLGVPDLGVAHQHAHLASALVDHAIDEPVLGIVLDDPAVGPDGALGGGEILLGDLLQCRRLARFTPLAMPGGVAAVVREPWRMAVSALDAADPGERLADELELGGGRLASARASILSGGHAAPRTTSCTRLLDAAAAILGLTDAAGDEGLAAARLEALAFRARGVEERAASTKDVVTARGGASPSRDGDPSHSIPLAIIETSSLVQEVARQRLAGRDVHHIAFAFLDCLATRIAQATTRLVRFTRVSTVVITGNASVHRILVESLKDRLELAGLHVLLPERVPGTDAGLAVGQAAVACARLATLAGGNRLGSFVT